MNKTILLFLINFYLANSVSNKRKLEGSPLHEFFLDFKNFIKKNIQKDWTANYDYGELIFMIYVDHKNSQIHKFTQYYIETYGEMVYNKCLISMKRGMESQGKQQDNLLKDMLFDQCQDLQKFTLKNILMTDKLFQSDYLYEFYENYQLDEQDIKLAQFNNQQEKLKNKEIVLDERKVINKEEIEYDQYFIKQFLIYLRTDIEDQLKNNKGQNVTYNNSKDLFSVAFMEIIKSKYKDFKLLQKQFNLQ